MEALPRVILHCDMNNYFATVEEKYSPELRQYPFAVCGDPEMRHSIVMAKNALAKKAGVITGISFNQARKLCPQLRCVRADYPKYLAETKSAREIYKKYSDKVIPYGLDEAWLDLTGRASCIDEGRQIADLIRLEIKYSQCLSASVGVSDNLIYAKIGSDFKKPDATTVVDREFAFSQPAEAMLFVGQRRCEKLNTNGIITIGDIFAAGSQRMIALLGRAGYELWRYANGDDRGFHPENDSIKSIGNTITPPADINSLEDASAVLYLLACSVSERLRRHGLQAAVISVVMKDSRFNSCSRQCKCERPVNEINSVFNRAYELFLRNYSWENPLRSVGIRADLLTGADTRQLSLYGDEESATLIDIDERIKKLNDRFGTLVPENSTLLEK